MTKGFFGPLKSIYSVECDKWMVNNPGRAITQREISTIFRLSYERVATIEKAKNSFKATGICPHNPESFSVEDFEPSCVTEQAQGPVDEISNKDNSDLPYNKPESPKTNETSVTSPSVLLPLPKATHEQKRK